MITQIWIGWGLTLVIILGIARQDLIYRRRMLDRIGQIEIRMEGDMDQAREALATYKLEVARGYVSVGYLKDVDQRLTERLIRIEAKLDAAASA